MTFTQNMVCTVLLPHGSIGLGSEVQIGPVVRIAPNLIVFDDPRLISKIYHRNADKTDFYHTSILGNTRSAFQIIGAKDHLVRRKLLTPSVSHTPHPQNSIMV